MPIYRSKKRGCWVFEFDRRIGGRRVRAQKDLPRSWNQAQADAYDRKESARLYAVAQGVGGHHHLIDDAVALYLKHRVPELKHGHDYAAELALLLPFYEGRPMSALPDVCKAYRLNAERHIAKRKGRLSPATVMNRIRYLTAACRYAWKHHGMGDRDPAAGVTVPQVRNASQVYLDRRQMLMLALKIQERRVRSAVRIAFYSGMRFSEIELAEVVGSAFVLADTKNGDRRIIPIHPRIRSAAVASRAPYHVVRYHVATAAKSLGMTGVTFHKLRHSAASAMLAQGVDLFTVGAVLGHRSAASTKRYAHMATERLKDAVGTIGRKVA